MQLDTSKHFILSRTDSIGDVILTFPMCVWIKESFPNAKITFLGTNYTQEIIEKFTLIDAFLSKEYLSQISSDERNELLKCDVFIHVFPDKQVATWAKDAVAPIRIGTSHRLHHAWTCNKRVSFSRKSSNLHEAQLNFNLLRPLGLKDIPELNTINAATKFFQVNTEPLALSEIALEKAIILHPKSKGSALEWPIEKYFELAQKLRDKGYTVLFTGTEKEGELFRKNIPAHPSMVDLTGQLTLNQFIGLISKSQALVACSTGPYHIAGLVGTHAIGLFSMKRPIFPMRWKAIGNRVDSLVFDPNCSPCLKLKECRCIEQISVDQVLERITNG